METHFAFLVLGGLLLAGLVADEIGRRSRLPRVTLLILFGLAAGPSGLDLLPAEFSRWYEFLAATALTMVAFLLGGTLSLRTLRRRGREIVGVSVVCVAATVLCVGGGLAVLGFALPLALLLAGIATATDPAATQDVVRQAGARGPFTDTLLGVVAVDDAWALIGFSLLLIVAKSMFGDGAMTVLGHGLYELGGALLVGAAVGLPAAYLTGRLQPGEPIQAEALGVVFLCAGFAIWLGVSFLLAGMIAGALVVNLARHHTRAFHEISHIEWPFMVFFFVLAGASFHLESLGQIGVLGAAYVVLRVAGRLAGGWLGGRIAGAQAVHRRWIGMALIPQAGVALGMAIVAGNHFPAMAETLLAVAVGTTILFELAGPVLTDLALRQVGETQ